MAMATQFLAGTTVLVVAMQLAWDAVGPSPDPIIINSLTYEAGYVKQDRTVTTSGPFKAIWEAQVVSAPSGDVVPGCQGSGSWEYPPGRREPKFPLAEWVGNPNCHLPPGTYILMATYSAGEFKTVARGRVFEVTE